MVIGSLLNMSLFAALMGYVLTHYCVLHNVILTGKATLKKHYNALWMSLPENHLITLERFCDINLYGMYDEVVDQIVSSTNSQWSNKKILDLLISVIKNDNQLLQGRRKR